MSQLQLQITGDKNLDKKFDYNFEVISNAILASNGLSSGLYNKMVFVAEENLNEDGDYVISSEDIGALIVFFLLDEASVDAKVRFPDGQIDTTENLIGKNISMVFVNNGEFQKTVGFPFVKPLNSSQAFNGISNPSQEEGGTISGEIISGQVVNVDEFGTTVWIPNIPIIHDDGVLKTMNRFIFDKVNV